MDLLISLPLAVAGVVVAVILVAFPFLVLIWLYDIRRASRRQADLLERMGHAQGWLASVPPRK